MEEILTQYEKLHPYSTRARIIREIGRVKKMSPESEKIFGQSAICLSQAGKKCP